MVKTSYMFHEGKPNISLQIEKDVDGEQTFHGVQVSGKVPSFVQGEKYQYYGHEYQDEQTGTCDVADDYRNLRQR